MNIATIKRANEKMPDWIKSPFSRIIRKQLIHNCVFTEQYRILSHEGEESCADVLHELKKCLCHAYEHTVYYHQLFDEIGFKPDEFSSLENLKMIPLLTKDVLRDQYEKIAADDIDDFYEVTTGGTSGEPIHILMDKNAIYREWAFVYYYWSKYGYDYKSSKLATLRGVDFDGKWYKYNPLYSELRLNPFQMDERTIFRYVKKIRKYGADFLYGYPSAIYNFCRLCRQSQIKLSGIFKGVFLISENVYRYQLKMIENVIHAPVAMFYGHSERAVFAEQIKNGGYIFNKRYGIAEILEDGRLAVTGFLNYKMPLIRYLVDDSVIRRDDGAYDIIGHHDDDLLFGRDGVQISMAAFNFHDDSMNGVKVYQFVQNKIGECEMHVVCDDDLDLEHVKAVVQGKLGKSIICTVNKVDNIQYTKRGKYKMLIQSIEYPFGGGGGKYSLLLNTNFFAGRVFSDTMMEYRLYQSWQLKAA